MRRTQSYVGHVLLNRQHGENETLSGSANTREVITVSTESEFKPGDRVKNTKTGETGTVASAAPIYPNATPVIFDKEFEEWGTIWDVPTHRLELIP
jgi:hypothetical protein